MRGDKVENVKPLTIVEEGKTSPDELRELIRTTLVENGPLLQAYHDLWYNAKFTWPYTHFLNVGCMKSPNDLWVYQALLTELRPKTIIETGTYQGASALWFAFLMDMLGIEEGKIYTIDYEDFRRNPIVMHPRITFIGADSTNPDVRDAIVSELPEEGTRLICLDADHSAEHVLKELKLYAPLCRVGDVLVVEDTNIGWPDQERVNPDTGEVVLVKGDRGARGGLQDYVDEHNGEFMQDPLCERYLLTMNPGGWLRRVAPCSHVL